ncbi:MAG: hypothetical protein QXE29_03555 [Candidatus Hadarchaeales archaeon]
MEGTRKCVYCRKEITGDEYASWIPYDEPWPVYAHHECVERHRKERERKEAILRRKEAAFRKWIRELEIRP